MHTNQKTTIIRCDDIFVDSDPQQFEKICQTIRRYEFDHLIGITPLGEGKKLWASKTVLKVPLARSGFFINRLLLKMTGERYIGNNPQLLRILNTEFSKHGAVSALHGLHHYRYDTLPQTKVWEELSAGKELLKELFNVNVKVFAAPFNAWDRKTEVVCENLSLSIDQCFTAFDSMIRYMNSHQIEQLAKKQSLVEVLYHPYQLANLEKFELYLKMRKKYS